MMDGQAWTETGVEPSQVERLLTDTTERLAQLGYDRSHASFGAQAWPDEPATWKYSPGWSTKLPSIYAPTAVECYRKAREWLADLETEESRLAKVLGFAP